MQCRQCRAENPLQAKFCMECAAPLARKCSACGAELPAKAKFCFECAHPVGQAVPTAVASPAPATYTPQHLAERILTSRDALEGERKQVTVLFADLKGSMELLAERDPEEARAILDPVLERMMEAVHRYEGTVNQVLGDGIMALFGAPLAHEDHAVRACYAALAMQDAMRAHAAVVRRAHGVEIQIRVGLNSGEVIVRAIGNDLHMDYSAIGQTTHLAARMEQLATPGTIRLAPETLRLVEGLVQVQALGAVPIKGLPEPVEVYELLGAAPTRSRLHAAAGRGLTRFVGRDAELDTLRRTLERAGAGQGQVVALVGEPGVGKSRLVWELTHSHRTEGWLVLQSRSVSYGKATPYLPVLDLLRAYCGIEMRDDARRRRERVVGKLLSLDRALEPTLPALLALLDVPVEDAAWEALDPPQRRQRTLDALKRLLLRESAEQPLLLVFEDLHWIDSETQALLDSLVDSLPTARLLLLVNYRTEYTHPWGSRTYYAQLRLDPLPPASAEELLAALLGDDAGLAPLKEVLVARTEGNPFFLEESVRTLVETGALVGERGAYHLTGPLVPTQMPATVQAVLAARIDRLAPEDKRLLQTAAVVGKDVRFGLLQAIGEAPEPALRESLARLQGAELLYETALFPDLEYTFKHALTHEVAYGSLLQERRRALHAQIVAAIETRYADRLAEQVERLAHHALHGELWNKAAAYLRQAAAKAAALSANYEAVARLEEAIVVLARLPESRVRQEQAIEVRLELRPLFVVLAQYERLTVLFDEADGMARALGDRRRLARIASAMIVCLMARGAHDRALDSAHRALALADTEEDVAVRAESIFRLGQIHWLMGDYPRAMDWLGRNVDLLSGELALQRLAGASLPSVSSRTFLMQCHSERGEFQQGLAQSAEIFRLAEASNLPFTLSGAWYALGRLALVRGEHAQAIAAFERVLAIAEAGQIVSFAAYASAALSYGYALAGRLEEARALLAEAVHRTEFARSMVMQAEPALYRAQTYLLVGQPEEARRGAQHLLERCRDRGERGHEAWTLRLLAEIAAHADPPDAEQAESHYSHALALAEELGMRPLAAHCHLGLGTLYQKGGRSGEAQAELAIAAEMYRAMEMTFWLEKAEAALAQVAR